VVSLARPGHHHAAIEHGLCAVELAAPACRWLRSTANTMSRKKKRTNDINLHRGESWLLDWEARRPLLILIVC